MGSRRIACRLGLQPGDPLDHDCAVAYRIREGEHREERGIVRRDAESGRPPARRGLGSPAPDCPTRHLRAAACSAFRACSGSAARVRWFGDLGERGHLAPPGPTRRRPTPSNEERQARAHIGVELERYRLGEELARPCRAAELELHLRRPHQEAAAMRGDGAQLRGPFEGSSGDGRGAAAHCPRRRLLELDRDLLVRSGSRRGAMPDASLDVIRVRRARAQRGPPGASAAGRGRVDRRPDERVAKAHACYVDDDEPGRLRRREIRRRAEPVGLRGCSRSAAWICSSGGHPRRSAAP